MGHIFSKKKNSINIITEQDKAVLQLKTTRDKIKQYQKRAESTLEKDRELAKQLIQNNKKERAKLLLKKKRFIEEKLKLADGQLSNVEQLIEDIEYAQVEMKVVDTLKIGNETLKEINQLMNITDIEKILDETQEAFEKQKEIDALLSGVILSEEDEGEIDNELKDLLLSITEEEIPSVIEEELPETPSVIDNPDVFLPDVPVAEPVEAVKVKSKRRKVEAS